MSVLLRLCTLLSFALFVPAVAQAATLENPKPDSFQSGIGVISGWVCDAQTIEVSFDGGPPQAVSYGTSRGDTQGDCGDADNGFGLLFNWNLLGEGVHTVTAYADGVEFASATVTVTTLGAEYRTGLSRTVTLADFPTAGTDVELQWQESQQNFVITSGSPRSGGTAGAPPNVLENPKPGSFQSGIGVISGWVCDAQTIEVSFDGGPRQAVSYGTSRGDTQGACGDADNGFGLLFNWNLLGAGVHTVTAYADGVEFASVPVTVTTLGAEYRTGLSRAVTLADFPEVGTDVELLWQESQQNFVLSFAAPTTRTVDVRPTLRLPAGVSIPNVDITSMLSATTAAVRAGPAPTLLLADDAGGTVLLALADMNGGFLSEATGEVDVSIHSTAVVLVALAAGYRLSDVDQDVVDRMRAHPQWSALMASLSGLLSADPNFLDRLYEHPEVVASIRALGTALRDSDASAAAQSIQAASALPDGARHTSFRRGSPWAADAPWVWYGEAHRVRLSAPFLAASEGTPGKTATANPNFVDYALEVYEGDTYVGWYYVPGNSTQWTKLRTSYAAYRAIPLSGSATRVEFVRYRLSAGSSRAAAVSFMNTFRVVLAGLSLVAPLESVEKVLKRFDPEKKARAIAGCVADLISGVSLPSAVSDRQGLARQWLRFAQANAQSWMETLLACDALAALLPLKQTPSPDDLAATIAKFLRMTPIGWILIGFEAANETIPRFSSYLLPVAGDAEYHLGWECAAGGRDLTCVSSRAGGCGDVAPPDTCFAWCDTRFKSTWTYETGEGFCSVTSVDDSCSQFRWPILVGGDEYESPLIYDCQQYAAEWERYRNQIHPPSECDPGPCSFTVEPLGQYDAEPIFCVIDPEDPWLTSTLPRYTWHRTKTIYDGPGCPE